MQAILAIAATVWPCRLSLTIRCDHGLLPRATARKGPTGPKGPKVPKDHGPKGPRGPRGPRAQRAQGSKGPKDPRAQGPQGPRGAQGTQGPMSMCVRPGQVRPGQPGWDRKGLDRPGLRDQAWSAQVMLERQGRSQTGQASMAMQAMLAPWPDICGHADHSCPLCDHAGHC